MSVFEWNPKKNKAALALATGLTQAEAAAAAKVTDRTIRRWLDAPEFQAEVDRLSCMVDISSRAERLRIAMRAARAKVTAEKIETDKDLLDWLRFAQSETTGIKLDLLNLQKAFTGDE